MTPEQIEKAKACKTAEELFALAKEEGMELSEKELDAVSGGTWINGQYFKCTTFGCGGYDCFVFSCSSVNCTAVECSVY